MRLPPEAPAGVQDLAVRVADRAWQGRLLARPAWHSGVHLVRVVIVETEKRAFQAGHRRLAWCSMFLPPGLCSHACSQSCVPASLVLLQLRCLPVSVAFSRHKSLAEKLIFLTKRSHGCGVIRERFARRICALRWALRGSGSCVHQSCRSQRKTVPSGPSHAVVRETTVVASCRGGKQ
jgi:hypothetical protein